MNLEISENPEILFDASIPVTQLKLLGRRLHDKASILDLDKATDAVGKSPDGVSGCQYRDGRQFYMRDGVEVEYSLPERVIAVVQHGGWLTFPKRYGFRIWYGQIVEFAVHGGVLEFFQRLGKSEIIDQFGEPDFIDVDVTHGDLMSTTFVYNRQISIYYDEWDHIIKMINIGESLLYDEQGKIKGPWPVTH